MHRIHSLSRFIGAFAVVASMPLHAATGARLGSSKTVGPDMVWVVRGTKRLRRLSVAQRATVVAPHGYSLTLTVDGIERDLKPGVYQGGVVLTVTRNMVVRYNCGLPCDNQALPPEYFRSAVDVKDGRYLPHGSVAAAVIGGQVTGREARAISITSRGANFNGIMVRGDSRYAIVHSRIDFTGNGGNDFDGYASGIMASGHAKVLVEGTEVTTRGVARGALYAGGHSTVTVNDSTIRVYNGTLPSGYRFVLRPGRMLEVPWMLGITGNVRATLLTGYATGYFNNDRIIAQGWGALSTDMVKRTRMYVRNSTVETTDSGYGAYSLGDSWDRFYHCRFRVAGMALIEANGGSATFTDGTLVDSRRYGVVMHSPAKRVGTLVIDKGSIFRTKLTAIEVKGVAARVVVDDAKLIAGNGMLLQAMVNDDPFAPVPPAGADTVVQALIRHTALRGDVVNSRTNQGGMVVTLRDARLVGAISTATAAPAGGAKPSAKTYYLIGDVENKFGSGTGPYGLDVSLQGRSTWVVTKTSYVTRLAIGAHARIAARGGMVVRLTVNGTEQPLKAGVYKGKIILAVSRV